MDKYIAYIELPYGNRRFVKSIDRDKKVVETTSEINEALLITKDEKPFVKRRVFKLYPSDRCAFSKIEKYDNVCLYVKYEFDSPGDAMLSWMKGDKEKKLKLKNFIEENKSSEFKTFGEFIEKCNEE